MPGSWEGDLVVGGAGRSCLVTLVERKTRYLEMRALPRHDSRTVVDLLKGMAASLPEGVRRAALTTLTWDQGAEMALYSELVEAAGVRVYFCDPRSPWQKGANENTNGLIRQFFPKGTEFDEVTEEEVRRVQDLINGRARDAGVEDPGRGDGRGSGGGNIGSVRCNDRPTLPYWMARKRYEYSYRAIILTTIAISLGNAGLGLLAVLLNEQKDLARIVSCVLVQCIVGGILYIVNLKYVRKAFCWDYVKFALLFNLPLLPHYAAMYVLDAFDRIMIQAMVGFSAAALYSVACNLGNVLKIVTNSINNSIVPWMYEKLG